MPWAAWDVVIPSWYGATSSPRVPCRCGFDSHERQSFQYFLALKSFVLLVNIILAYWHRARWIVWIFKTCFVFLRLELTIDIPWFLQPCEPPRNIYMMINLSRVQPILASCHREKECDLPVSAYPILRYSFLGSQLPSSETI